MLPPVSLDRAACRSESGCSRNVGRGLVMRRLGYFGTLCQGNQHYGRTPAATRVQKPSLSDEYTKMSCETKGLMVL